MRIARSAAAALILLVGAPALAAPPSWPAAAGDPAAILAGLEGAWLGTTADGQPFVIEVEDGDFTYTDRSLANLPLDVTLVAPCRMAVKPHLRSLPAPDITFTRDGDTLYLTGGPDPWKPGFNDPRENMGARLGAGAVACVGSDLVLLAPDGTCTGYSRDSAATTFPDSAAAAWSEAKIACRLDGDALVVEGRKPVRLAASGAALLGGDAAAARMTRFPDGESAYAELKARSAALEAAAVAPWSFDEDVWKVPSAELDLDPGDMVWAAGTTGSAVGWHLGYGRYLGPDAAGRHRVLLGKDVNWTHTTLLREGGGQPATTGDAVLVPCGRGVFCHARVLGVTSGRARAAMHLGLKTFDDITVPHHELLVVPKKGVGMGSVVRWDAAGRDGKATPKHGTVAGVHGDTLFVLHSPGQLTAVPKADARVVSLAPLPIGAPVVVFGGASAAEGPRDGKIDAHVRDETIAYRVAFEDGTKAIVPFDVVARKP
ncbi:MAG: hypothetical protein EP329_11025 [Deltaproteobacteria bacterium]|nr:MAG: hypothetical protein EP329_11025 [Deltaproteobacteria bacterium]